VTVDGLSLVGRVIQATDVRSKTRMHTYATQIVSSIVFLKVCFTDLFVGVG
jgi:hypothetical protein